MRGDRYMKKSLNVLYTYIIPAILTIVLLFVRWKALAGLGIKGHAQIVSNVLFCVTAAIYSKKINPLTIFRNVSFLFCFAITVPKEWIDSVWFKEIPTIDIMSSVNSEVYVFFRMIAVVGVFAIACSILEEKIKKTDMAFIALAVFIMFVGIAVPNLLFVTCYAFSICLLFAGADLYTKVCDKNGGIFCDILLFGFMYLKALLIF